MVWASPRVIRVPRAQALQSICRHLFEVVISLCRHMLKTQTIFHLFRTMTKPLTWPIVFLLSIASSYSPLSKFLSLPYPPLFPLAPGPLNGYSHRLE